MLIKIQVGSQPAKGIRADASETAEVIIQRFCDEQNQWSSEDEKIDPRDCQIVGIWSEN